MILRSDGLTPITSKAGTFSFDLILCEMMTPKIPHCDCDKSLIEEDGLVNASVMSATDTSAVCSTIRVKYHHNRHSAG